MSKGKRKEYVARDHRSLLNAVHEFAGTALDFTAYVRESFPGKHDLLNRESCPVAQMVPYPESSEMGKRVFAELRKEFSGSVVTSKLFAFRLTRNMQDQVYLVVRCLPSDGEAMTVSKDDYWTEQLTKDPDLFFEQDVLAGRSKARRHKVVTPQACTPKHPMSEAEVKRVQSAASPHLLVYVLDAFDGFYGDDREKISAVLWWAIDEVEELSSRVTLWDVRRFRGQLAGKLPSLDTALGWAQEYLESKAAIDAERSRYSSRSRATSIISAVEVAREALPLVMKLGTGELDLEAVDDVLLEAEGLVAARLREKGGAATDVVHLAEGERTTLASEVVRVRREELRGGSRCASA